MGWKKTLRSMGASARRSERNAQRRRRALEIQSKQLEKMQELERATYEVEVYENRIELLLSVHKECSDTWDWIAIKFAAPPASPERMHKHEELAQSALDEFKPGPLDKLLRRVDSKRDKLVQALDDAKKADEEEYQEAQRIYEQECENWEAASTLASRVLSGDLGAYLDAINQTDPFSDIVELGSTLEFQAHSTSLIVATLHVQGEKIVPSEIKSLLKSGKLSVKQMPKTRFYEIYQDHVCGSALRIARELFALLPIKMAIVNVVDELLDTHTGHMELKPILSVAIPRETLAKLNFETIDPSDSMRNFVHRMTFGKTKGFQAVEAINFSDLGLE